MSSSHGEKFMSRISSYPITSCIAGREIQAALQVTGEHGVTLDMLKQIPAAMADPIAIFDSATGKAKGDVVFMLEVKDAQGKTVVVPVALQSKTGGGRREVNIVKSAYGKGGKTPAVNWFHAQAKENARYVNGQKFESWADTSGVQFPSRPSNAHGNTIHTEADLVKLREANPTIYQTGARGAVDLTPERAAIRLFEKADLSTIPHESAHIFLDTLMRVVADDGMQARALYESRIAEGIDQAKAQKIYERHLAGVEQARAFLRIQTA